MEANKKEAWVHMLPTEEKSKILYIGDWDKLSFDNNAPIEELDADEKYQHLYFTSDEKPKSGKEVYYIDKFTGKVTSSGGAEYGSKQQVIIASTDTKLTELIAGGGEGNAGIWKFYPKPTQAFIEAYCKQGGIDKVLVEYDTIIYEGGMAINPFTEMPDKIKHIFIKEDCVFFENSKTPYSIKSVELVSPRLKVDPIHNTITTHRIVEKTYTREEMEEVIHRAISSIYDSEGISVSQFPDDTINGIYGIKEWLEENL